MHARVPNGAVTEGQWKQAFQLDKVGRHLEFAYHELQDLQEQKALAILAQAITALRTVIPNAFPATYDAD